MTTDHDTSLHCADDRRRGALRAVANGRHGTDLNGLDDAEPASDRRSVLVYFLGPIPRWLDPEDLRFRGHDAPRATALDPDPEPDDPHARDCVRLRLDRPGRGCLELCLVSRDDPAVPPDGIDPRFACLAVDFDADCPSELDCLEERACPPPPRDDPAIDYLAKDYASFRRLALERLSTVSPEWRDRLVPDLGVTLVELLSYAGDRLSYYQDAVATEAYLGTARRRASLRRHARLVDYRMHEGCNARAFVHLEVRGDPVLDLRDVGFVTRLGDAAPLLGPVVPEHALADVPPAAFERFTPLEVAPPMLVAVHAEAGGASRWRLASTAETWPLRLYERHNRIALHTWGDRDCCLPEGATAATLVAGPAVPRESPGDGAAAPVDGWQLHLAPNDLLLFEEVLGPRSGLRADADPTHRHVVRLTSVRHTRDPLLEVPLVEVAWDPADALPFPLCVSSTTDDCRELAGVSVARGNLVAVDHGHASPDEDLGCVPCGPRHVDCVCGRRDDVHTEPGRYRPRLSHGPLTHAQPVVAGTPAAALPWQDPRRAVPKIHLVAVDDPGCGPVEPDQVRDDEGPASAPGDRGPLAQAWWQPRPDLLASGPDDHHVVAEPDEEGVATLRFGDGELGARPRAGWRFVTRYRIGNGPAGNVAAEAIAHLCYDRQRIDGIVAVRNPLPAVGGTTPEQLDRVRLQAPFAATDELRRAVVAEDYAAIVMRDFPIRVQRAAAAWRFVGSRDEIDVAVDPRGTHDAAPALLSDVRVSLEPYRRIGHDLRVLAARQVALDLALELCLTATASRSDVRAAVLARIGPRRLPDGTPGRFHPDAVTFGEAVRVSNLVAIAAAIPGVVRATVTRLRRRFDAEPRDPAARPLELGVLQLGPLELPRCDNDPAASERGRLEVELVGGR